MANLNANRILDIAEQTERDGANFYRKAAEFANEDCRSVLLALATMECNHEDTFAAMRADLLDGELQLLVTDHAKKGALYLQAVVDGKIFGANPSSELTGKESIDRIFEIAIGMEKDSIVFYQSMKALIPPGEAWEQLDKIIDEETGHILELTRN
ncbi:MAG: ferritin family protein [Phycisphaerae bacterium]|jgi:rubrerythrin|nr:ferritin family protein [Phycisphaerae bacterium]